MLGVERGLGSDKNIGISNDSLSLLLIYVYEMILKRKYRKRKENLTQLLGRNKSIIKYCEWIGWLKK